MSFEINLVIIDVVLPFFTAEFAEILRRVPQRNKININSDALCVKSLRTL